MLSPVQSRQLADLAGIRHGFFTRLGGVSEGLYAGLNCGFGSKDASAQVSENRRRVAGHLGAIGGEVVTLYQEHGQTARTVTGPEKRDNLPKADAVVSTTPGLAIGVLTADCTPVLFADRDAGVVAAAHAGWRGAVSGILESAICEMERNGAVRSRIRAAIGPCIHQRNYEVGAEFAADFVRRDASYSVFFSSSPDEARPHFDLPGFVAHRLQQSGLTHVELASSCTYENESLFFSYRRSTHRQEPDYGRQISAIVVA